MGDLFIAIKKVWGKIKAFIQNIIFKLKVKMGASAFQKESDQLLKQVFTNGGHMSQVESMVMVGRLQEVSRSNPDDIDYLITVHEMLNDRDMNPSSPDDLICIALNVLLEKVCEKYGIERLLKN